MSQPVLEELRWKKFPVLDRGYVCLVDVMGDDRAIVQAARVSYGAGTQHISDDRALIRYLMRHHHTTPFEMAEIKLLVRVPMDIWRQWIRHRTASVNEYSTRYSVAIEDMAKTAPRNWRLQSTTNNQGSYGFFPDDHGLLLSFEEQDFHTTARKLYDSRIAAGMAREQARKDLPLCTYTEAYWKMDLHNLFRFLYLRMDSKAQSEIVSYATIIGEQIVKPLFPLAWEAFVDYQLQSMQLSRMEQELAGILVTAGSLPVDWDRFSELQLPMWGDVERCRERDECFAKFVRLGLCARF